VRGTRASATAFAPASVGNVAVGFDILGHTVAALGDRVTVSRRAEPGVAIRSITGVVQDLPLAAEKNTAGMAALALQRELGLPHGMVYRHPFPGPGLGVRILGEVRREFVEKLQLADDIFIDELRKHDLYDQVSQAFAVFLPVKSVGVMGDGRRYDYVIALRAVETVDFMTAHWARLPYEFLDHVARRIVNEVKGVSRVVYDISGKPPATIEWE